MNSHRRGGPEPALTDSSKNIDGYGRTDTRPGRPSGRLKSIRMTADDIAVRRRAGLDQDDTPHTHKSPGGAPYRRTL